MKGPQQDTQNLLWLPMPRGDEPEFFSLINIYII